MIPKKVRRSHVGCLRSQNPEFIRYRNFTGRKNSGR